MKHARHITLPAGFVAGGVHCGIKTTDQEDLSIIAAQCDASVAIVTTRNQVVGAPILWCRTILPRGYGKARGIVINSGCSNVCNGAPGLRDAETMARETAKRLGAATKKILVASTGVIGRRLPMTKVRSGIAKAARRLGLDVPRQMLHAARIKFTHPATAKPVEITAPLPDDFQTVLATLRA